MYLHTFAKGSHPYRLSENGHIQFNQYIDDIFGDIFLNLEQFYSISPTQYHTKYTNTYI